MWSLRKKSPEERARIRAAKARPLWRRTADSPDGRDILYEAQRLSLLAANQHLSDAELIRLAYWGYPNDWPRPRAAIAKAEDG